MPVRTYILLLVVTFAPAFSQNFAEAEGARIHYETVGQGEPLLLIHGFSGTGGAWQPVRDALAAKFRLILVDMRGHGRSTNPGGTFTHRQSARDMFALLDALGIRSVKAMGISSGGMTLLHMATQQPDRIEAMALIGATIYFPEQARAVMRKTDPDNIPPAALERWRKQHVRGDEQIRQLRTNFRDFKDSYEDMNFTAPLLSTIKARTLIIHGDRDEFFPVNIPVEMYRSIPRSFLWILPNGGHVPVFGPAKDLFVATALDFFSGKGWGAQ
jgi:pimeloyl-ACP methyl ester carboxylesterase